MAATSVLTVDAVDEVTDIADQHEATSAGAGQRFRDKFMEHVRRICVTPHIRLPVYGPYRLWYMKPYKYYIIYTYDGATVTVHSVYHTSRDPAGWQNRVP